MVSPWKCFASLLVNFILTSFVFVSPARAQTPLAKASPTPAASPVAKSAAPTGTEEIKFEKNKIQVGAKTITVEVAETVAQQERGLMFRKSLGLDEGMLFIFKTEQPLYFWMKNTFIDLSIGYFDKQGMLIDIQEMKAVTSIMEDNLPNYPSKKPALYALEMNPGWFTKNKIKLGTKLKVLKDRQ